MSSAKITTIGFYNYMKQINDDLFKLMVLPESDLLHKDTLINTILMRGGEFEVLYSDPYFYQTMVGFWSDKWKHTIEKWVNALSVDYNPLENYDRIEEWVDLNTGTVSNKNVLNTSDSGITNTSATEAVSAYNSDVMRNDNSTKGANDYSNTSVSDNDSTRTDNLQGKHTGRLHGNIGVTTSQQMLQSELDIAKWNLYENITDLFLAEFVVPLY